MNSRKFAIQIIANLQFRNQKNIKKLPGASRRRNARTDCLRMGSGKRKGCPKLLGRPSGFFGYNAVFQIRHQRVNI